MKFLAIVFAAVLAQGAELTIHVNDPSGKPVWARLEIRGPDGKMHQPAGSIVDRSATNRPGGQPWYTGNFVVNGEARLVLAPARYTVVADRGPEYERIERTVEVAADKPAEVSFKMAQWIQMNELGWYSGDMHVHRPVQDAASLALAEDLNVSVVFTMWNRRNLWDGKPLPNPPIQRVDERHFLSLMNAEDERGGGAWMLHGISKPLALGVGGTWFPAGINFVRQVRPDRTRTAVLPWFDSEKPIWWEVPVIMALATPDSIGVLHNHFNQYGMDAGEAWGRPRDKTALPGFQGFANYSLGLVYRYWNLGFRVPASAGSASGVLPNPVGYNRIYARVDGPLTVEKWYRAIRDGNSFVTNGPMMFFSVKGDSAVVDVRSREPIDRVELLANGKVLERVDAASARNLKRVFRFDARAHSWIAARAFVKNDVTIRLAHSSPVWLPGKWNAREDAGYFVDWMDALIGETQADPKRFASESEKDQILELYRRARDFYIARGR